MDGALPLVRMKDIRKRFGSTEVLHGVDFEVHPGEVHVLAGENGAGKSTLIKILSGAHAEYSGELFVRGSPVRFSRPSQAVRAGIATIHQELSLVPSMSVSDNLFLGQERVDAFSRMDFHSQAAESMRILQEMHLECSPHRLVETLPISAQQTLEIARALARDASVVVFDEPTSALGEQEVEDLFERILELKSMGRGIVYITHKMEEIYRLADRITVLRDGKVVTTAPAGDLPAEELVMLMVGQEFEQVLGKRPARAPDPGAVPVPPVGADSATPLTGDAILEVQGLHVAHPRIRTRRVVDGIDFTLRKGEILGLAGLQGCGKSEVLHALFGALEGRASGEVVLSGSPLPLRDPTASVERGLLLLTNDRKGLGLAPEMSVSHSISLSSLDRFASRWGLMRQGEERHAVEALARGFRLKAPSLDAPVAALSGGNQQKAYLARCLMPDPEVLLLDEPTRGIDVGAKADIYEMIGEWVRRGIGILLITSEMDELLTLSHRILVLYQGRLVEEFSRESASKDGILAAAMGYGAHLEVPGSGGDFKPYGSGPGPGA
jgi:ABC-type sugar transport system ATPase subunit